MRNAWCSFRKYTLELYDLPSAAFELKIRMLRAEVLETMRLRHMEPARLPPRHTAPSPPQDPDSLHRLTKAQSHRPPDFLYGHAYIKTGSETSRRRYARGWTLFAGFVARMEDTKLPKCVMFREFLGGAGCVGGQEKQWMRCFLDEPGASGIDADQWTTAAQDEGEWCRTAEQGAEHFMTK